MARSAIAGDTRVAENRGSKRCITVTGIAVLTGWHVNRGTVLANRSSELAIVTTGAAIGITRMNTSEEDVRCKTHVGVVTETAFILCRDMVR